MATAVDEVTDKLGSISTAVNNAGTSLAIGPAVGSPARHLLNGH